MKARRTPWYYMLACAIAGIVCGAVVAYSTLSMEITVLGAPYIVPVVLFILGIVALWLAWTVRAYTRGKIKYISPQRSYVTLIIAKSLEIATSFLAGWYGGQAIILIPHIESSFFRDIFLRCLIAMGVCIFDVICGIIAEYLCQIPPSDSTKDKKKQKTGNEVNSDVAEPVVGSNSPVSEDSSSSRSCSLDDKLK